MYVMKYVRRMIFQIDLILQIFLNVLDGLLAVRIILKNFFGLRLFVQQLVLQNLLLLHHLLLQEILFLFLLSLLVKKGIKSKQATL